MRKKEQMEALMEEPSIYKSVSIVRLQMVKEGRSLYGWGRFKAPNEAVDMVKPLFWLSDRELAVVVSLDTKCAPLAIEVVSVGNLDSCLISPQSIFKHALLNNARCVLCFHNHPSGDSEPSEEDKRVTERLYEAGKILGVCLLDHIIIGDDDYFSFREHDMLGKPYIDCA